MYTIEGVIILFLFFSYSDAWPWQKADRV